MMDQLLSMGFSGELAAQALAATGGKSTLEATDWILSQPSSSPDNHSTNPTSQPKLDRFFHVQSKQSLHGNKRPRPPSPSSSSPPPSSSHLEQSLVKVKVKVKAASVPLSERMRPRTLEDVVGQDLSFLQVSIRCHRLPSIILWGPPGSGKTSIARALLNSSSSYHFVSLSAVSSGVKDIREAVEEARKVKLKGKRMVLFVDEVHRFNKSQQDCFLPIIEDGTLVFIGATTENPSFHLVTPLLSRSRVITLTPLQPHHLKIILNRAVSDPDKGLIKSLPESHLLQQVGACDDAINFLSENCDGDARVALNALEIAATTAFSSNLVGDIETLSVGLEDVKEALRCKHLAYDRDGEEHYNLISALHKSMRGGDADASIYWLARMLEGGEQPLYIARRLIRFASEDVGLADPLALNQAVACYHACHFLGMPECNVVLAQCVAYLALAPKSVSVYRAIEAAQKAVKESVGQNEGVPLHLRNAPTKLMKQLGYGKGYIYTPDDPTADQSYLPPSLLGCKFLDWPPK